MRFIIPRREMKPRGSIRRIRRSSFILKLWTIVKFPCRWLLRVLYDSMTLKKKTRAVREFNGNVFCLPRFGKGMLFQRDNEQLCLTGFRSRVIGLLQHSSSSDAQAQALHSSPPAPKKTRYRITTSTNHRNTPLATKSNSHPP